MTIPTGMSIPEKACYRVSTMDSDYGYLDFDREEMVETRSELMTRFRTAVEGGATIFEVVVQNLPYGQVCFAVGTKLTGDLDSDTVKIRLALKRIREK